MCACVQLRRVSGGGKALAKAVKYEAATTPTQYNTTADSTLPQKRKRKREPSEETGDISTVFIQS